MVARENGASLDSISYFKKEGEEDEEELGFKVTARSFFLFVFFLSCGLTCVRRKAQISD